MLLYSLVPRSNSVSISKKVKAASAQIEKDFDYLKQVIQFKIFRFPSV